MDAITKEYGIKFSENDLLYSNEIIDIFNGNVTDYLDRSELYGCVGIYYEVVMENYALAKKYYLLGVETGCDDSTINLARIYLTIYGNHKSAKYYYKLAITKYNNIEAMISIGDIYLNISGNYDKAEQYYLMACKYNNPIAMNRLGNMYVTQDNYKTAETFYMQAIELNYLPAIYNMGSLFYKTMDYDISKKYFIMAMEKGYSRAILSIHDILPLVTITDDDIDLLKKYINVNSNNLNQLNSCIQTDVFRWYEIIKKLNVQCSPATAEIISNFELKQRYFSKTGDCTVCWNEQTTVIPFSWCNHLLCIECYKQVYNKPCPLCRRNS